MRPVVGVLRGGPSSEYEISLQSGAAVLAHLPKEKYEARDIFVDRTGAWHSRGVATAPERALAGVDAVINVIHGEYGEDGTLHRVLDPIGVPYSGPNSYDSVRAFNKHTAWDTLRKSGVKVPYSVLMDATGEPQELAQHVFRTFPQPSLVHGELARDYHALERAVAQATAPKIFVEEYISGPTASVAVVENFRNEPVYAAVPLPSGFTSEQKTQLAAMAKKVHNTLGLRHFSESVFVVAPRGIYVQAVYAQPRLHQGSNFVEGLQHVGASLSEFLDHVVGLMLKH